MILYSRLIIGNIIHGGIMVPTDSINQYILDHGATSAIYSSYYEYDNEGVEYFTQHNTIKGFTGKLYLNRILFDVDKKDLTDDHLIKKTRAFVSKLLSDYIQNKNHIQVYFSGTGFHIEIPQLLNFEPSGDIARVVKQVLIQYFPEGDSIYDRNRVIRQVHSLNIKSGLFKIPLSLNETETLSLPQIRELAISQRLDFPIINVKGVIVNGILSSALPIAPPKNIVKPTPSNIVTCMQKVYNEGPVSGTRHIHLLRLASAYRRAGIPKEAIALILTNWAYNIPPGEVVNIINSVFKNDYSYGCHDIVMAKYCDPKCIFFRDKNYGLEVVSAATMEKSFAEHVRTDFSETSFDLSSMYIMEPYKVYPGEFVLVMGDSGLGKTAWVQNICVNLPKMNILYLSLEVYQNLCYRRFIQIAHNMSKEQVISHYKLADNGLSSAINHIRVVTLSPDIDAIKRTVAELRPKVVVVDTTDCIIVNMRKEEVANEKLVANFLKSLAQSQDIIVIGVHHISKAAATGKLNIHSGKGSSAFEQKADKVIGIEGSINNPRRVLTSLKARDESPFRLLTDMNMDTFIFHQVNPHMNANNKQLKLVEG